MSGPAVSTPFSMLRKRRASVQRVGSSALVEIRGMERYVDT